MKNITHNQLLKLSEQYARHKSITHWRVSFLARGDGQFFSRLKKGKSCTLKTADNIMQWFSDNWPVDLEWPKGIERPEPRKEAA